MLAPKLCYRVTWLLTESQELNLRGRYTEARELNQLVEEIARGHEPPLHNYEISQREALLLIKNEDERNLKAKEMGILQR